MHKHPKKWVENFAHDLSWGKSLLQGEGSLIPMFILHNRDGSITPFCVAFKSPGHKHSVYQFMSIVMMANESIGFSFMCEGWMIINGIHHGEDAADAMERALAGPSPSQSENRIEVLTLMMVYRDDADERKVISTIEDMQRDWDGKLTGFKAHDTRGAIMEGAVVDIMPEEPPDQAHVMAARAFLATKADFIMGQLDIIPIEFGSSH
jgi:hypothetical protein